MIRSAIRILLLAFAVHAAGAQSADPPRTATPALTQRPPVIDGRLDDEVWRTATPLTGFVQRELREGEPVTERTEVRIASDGLALYIGAWLFDKDPAGIVSGEKIRDVSLDNSDYVAIILDTYLDRQNGFVFATTPAGVEYDGQVAKEGEGGGITVTVTGGSCPCPTLFTALTPTWYVVPGVRPVSCLLVASGSLTVIGAPGKSPVIW